MLRAVLLLLALGTVSPAGQPEEDAVRFEIATRSDHVTGSLRSLTGDGDLEVNQPDRTRIEATAWYALRRAGRSAPPLAGGLHLVSVDGDILPVVRPRLEEERLVFEHPDLNGGKPCTMPLAAAGMIWWSAPGPGRVEVLRRRLLREPRKQDHALLSNGDRVLGVPIRLDAFRLTLQGETGDRSLELKQVSCLVLSSDLAESLRPKGRFYQVVFRNREGTESARLGLTQVNSDGQSLGGKTLFGATFRVPLERIESVDVLGGEALFVTDLKPPATRQTPYLDLSWPVGIDATAQDDDLRLGEQSFARGLSLAAGTRVTYRIEEKFRRFEALVGLDPRTGREGGVRLEILRDGKPVVLEAPDLVGAETIRRLRIDVSGTQELTLGVLPGRRGAVQGHVNWVEPRLVK